MFNTNSEFALYTQKRYTKKMVHPADDIAQSLQSGTTQDRESIRRAYDFALKAHGDELRHSGEPYIVHPLAIAKTLTELGMDRDTVIAGLLHDTLEDTPCSEKDIERVFGAEVRFLVEGVTKLSKLRYRGLVRHVESLRRLLVATAADVRVIIIKLADRLHNMETLAYVEPRKQERIARETMEIFVPIAERLGMGMIKTRLHDLAFKMLEPAAYADAKVTMAKIRTASMKDLEEAVKDVKRELAAAKIRDFSTEARIKSISSLAAKMARKHSIDEVYDLFALRIIVPTSDACYQTLAVVHALWKPLPDRVKDFIARPKQNGYRSIHTTVATGRGLIVEVQIRTPEMHRESQFGIASHFAYKTNDAQTMTSIEWVRRFVPGFRAKQQRPAPLWLKELSDAIQDEEHDAVHKTLTEDFFAERIIVLTPKGDHIDLPTEATPIDFAYAIHSDLGDNAVGALVNQKLVALDTPLKNDDVVEIKLKKNGAPNQKWLEFVKTASARKRIRSALQKPTTK